MQEVLFRLCGGNNESDKKKKKMNLFIITKTEIKIMEYEDTLSLRNKK